MAKKKTNPIKEQPSPEDFELSDEEPAVVNPNEEQKLSSKFITFDCPICKGKLQLRNEILTNPKGINVLVILAPSNLQKTIRQ